MKIHNSFFFVKKQKRNKLSKTLITQELKPDYALNYILQNPTNFRQLLQT